MHDPRALLVASGRVEREQAVDECARRVPDAGVDDDAGRLVHHDEMLVLPGDMEIHLLRDERSGLVRKLDLELLPTL